MKIKSDPLISIVMNCHDGEKYLNESISSVINQTYKNWELIFFDNFSKDKSKEILKSFDDKRIRYFRSEKFMSLYEARNSAIQQCKGKLVAFLDTDDIWLNNKLEKQIYVYKTNKDCDLIYSNFFVHNEEKKKLKIFTSKKLPQGKITQDLLNNYRVGLLTILVKKDVFKKQLFNPDYNIIGDFDLVLSLSLSSNFYCVNEPLAKYRQHEKNLSKNLSLHIKEIENWISSNQKMFNSKGFSLFWQKIVLKKLKLKYYYNKLRKGV